MDHSNLPPFIIIDDDPINNHICSRYLQLVFPGAAITAFTSPRAGLDYILTNCAEPGGTEVIMLLDLNMPALNGWEVLELFKDFPEYIKTRFRIYILSSSINLKDKIRAEKNPSVRGFIEKPLTVAQLKEFFPEYARMDVENI